MSVVTLSPGDLIRLSAQDRRVVLFDFDTSNLPATVTLSGVALTILALRQNGVSTLSTDSESLVNGNRQYQARFLGTTANPGDYYEVIVKGTTNESPAQDKNYSIFVLIQD